MAATRAKRGAVPRSVVGSGVNTGRKVALAGLGVAGVAADAGAKLFSLGSPGRGAEVKKLEESVSRHENLRKDVNQTSTRLFEQRQRVVVEVIGPVEDYVNRLANTPKDFDKSVRAFRVATDRFEGVVQRVEEEFAAVRKLGGGGGLAGATAGVGLAAFGPTAAMAVATTFGTASTGTAISALSGAAATQAAAAWLGGGAVAAGGGGVAAGNALLALTGPVGWTVGGLALVGSGAYLRHRNGVLARRAVQERVRVEGEVRALRVAQLELAGLEERTWRHAEGTLAAVRWLRERAPGDYWQFDPGHKRRFGALVNHVRSLGELIRKEVALEAVS